MMFLLEREHNAPFLPRYFNFFVQNCQHRKKHWQFFVQNSNFSAYGHLFFIFAKKTDHFNEMVCHKTVIF